MTNKIQFIKLNLPQPLVNELKNIADTIDSINPFDLDQMHMTIVFLGDKKKLPNYKKSMEKINQLINNGPTISLTFSNYEIFGTNGNLLVAKFLISSNDKHKIIEFKKQFIEFGAPIEPFFSPHITIGKIKPKITITKQQIDLFQKPINITINNAQCLNL
jgi:2'-5' RNA ligase